jgi:hypothetical protein
MGEQKRMVAVISPWEKLAEVVKRKFRVESLPAEKKVVVWRDDLQTEQALISELQAAGVPSPEIREKRITNWKETE